MPPIGTFDPGVIKTADVKPTPPPVDAAVTKPPVNDTPAPPPKTEPDPATIAKDLNAKAELNKSLIIPEANKGDMPATPLSGYKDSAQAPSFKANPAPPPDLSMPTTDPKLSTVGSSIGNKGIGAVNLGLLSKPISQNTSDPLVPPPPPPEKKNVDSISTNLYFNGDNSQEKLSKVIGAAKIAGVPESKVNEVNNKLNANLNRKNAIEADADFRTITNSTPEKIKLDREDADSRRGKNSNLSFSTPGDKLGSTNILNFEVGKATPINGDDYANRVGKVLDERQAAYTSLTQDPNRLNAAQTKENEIKTLSQSNQSAVKDIGGDNILVKKYSPSNPESRISLTDLSGYI